MKAFNGYEEAKKAAQYTGGRLPVGAYVCKILNVVYNPATESGKNDIIELSFDIVEGEQKDFFKKQYQANQNEDKKWKGRVLLYCPLDDGTERDGWTKNSFAKWTNSFEESNSGYVWDWDEQKWKNKLVGIVFGETGTNIDGKDVLYTEARFPVDVETVRKGKAPTAKFKAKNGYTGTQTAGSGTTADASSSTDWMQMADDDGEGLPFNV